MEMSAPKSKGMHVHIRERPPVSTEVEVEALDLPHSCPKYERSFPTTRGLAVHRARWCRPGQRPASQRGHLVDKAVKLAKRKASAALLPPVVMEGESLETVYQFDYVGCRFTSHGDDAADMRHHGRTLAWSRPPLTAVTEAAPLRSERLFDPDARQRGVDANANSAGNAQQLQLPAIAPHHREIVSRGGHQAFVRPSDGCADAEAPLAGTYPTDACRPPSAPWRCWRWPTSWSAIPTWQPPDGHAPPPTQTSPASRRPPRMDTRWPSPLLPTGKPLRGETQTSSSTVDSMFIS